MSRFGPLVGAGWLAAHLETVVVVDFRWYLDGRSGRAAYDAAHIPGAVFLDLEAVTGTGGAGRHPLPAGDVFEARMREAGLNRNSDVVVYDDTGGLTAGRLWFLLRYFGHDRVAVLDGGLGGWTQPLSTEPVRPPAGDFTASEPHLEMVLDHEAVRSLPATSRVLDARASERYRGDVEPIDPRAGHIPGAVSAPWEANLDSERRFLEPAALRARFAALGVAGGPDSVAYCGSGVSACANLLALELAGLGGGRLYAGSWSDWSSRPEAPVATGPDP